MATNLQSRIRRIMRDRGWTQAEIAKHAGASKQAVSKWLNNGRSKIDPAFGFNLQDASGFSARWILLGQGPVHIVAAAKAIIRQHESTGVDKAKR